MAERLKNPTAASLRRGLPLAGLALAMVILGGAVCTPARPVADRSKAPPPSPTSEVATLDLPADASAEGTAGVEFDSRIELVAYRLGAKTLRPGGTLDVLLRWRSLGPIAGDLRAFGQLVDGAFEEIAGDDDVIGTRARPTSMWSPGDEGEHQMRLALPRTLRTDSADLRVGVLDQDRTTRLSVSFPSSFPGGDDWTTLAVFKALGPESNPVGLLWDPPTAPRATS